MEDKTFVYLCNNNCLCDVKLYAWKASVSQSLFVCVLQDLLKHTPKDHPDFPLLQDALRISQNFLSSINEEIDPRRTAVTTPKGEVCVCVCVWLFAEELFFFFSSEPKI